MIGEGTKVWFIPNCVKDSKFTPAERKAATVTGEIVYINWEHHYFTAEYELGGTKHLESFKFCQTGKDVNISG